MRIVASRKIDFDYVFDPNDKPVAYPGVGCSIRVSGDDNPKFSRISVRLYGFKEVHPGPVRAFAYVRVQLESSTLRPGITAISLDGFNPANWLDRDGAKTQAMWEVSSEDLMHEISRLRTEPLNLKIGYFLDNTEIIYSNQNNFDISALDRFERCAADNAVFSLGSSEK